MPVAQSDIVLVAPELASVPAGVFTQVIADVLLELSATAWGTKYDMGVKYLCAHVIALSYPDLVPGTVQQESAGQVSRMYAVAEARDTLESTRYGQRFQQIRRRLPGRLALT